MVTMKIKSRIKDSSGQNYVGVELNLNVHFLGGRFPRYLVTNLVTNLVNHQIR